MGNFVIFFKKTKNAHAMLIFDISIVKDEDAVCAVVNLLVESWFNLFANSQNNVSILTA